MQMFGKGHRLHIQGKRVQFEDERGNPAPLHDNRSITFPDIRISVDIVRELCQWLETAYQVRDPQVRMTVMEKPGSIYIVWAEGSFTFPPYAEPFQAKPDSHGALNEQGIRTISWILRAVANATFAPSVSNGTYSWSMPKPMQSEAATSSKLPNPLFAGRDKK